MTLNQVHSRLADETMRGTYQYAPIKIILAKVLSKNKSGKETLGFVEGDYMEHSIADIDLPCLSQGDYLLFLQAEWTVLNPWRKLITNIYAPDPLEIRRVPTSPELDTLFAHMDKMMNQRLAQGSDYNLPEYAVKEILA